MSHMSRSHRFHSSHGARGLFVGGCVLVLGGCSAVLWGQLFVMAAALGIFVGTLVLGRSAAASTASETSSTHH